MKPILWYGRWALAGAVLGHVAATLTAPAFIKFWRAPRGASDAMCQCSELITTTTGDLVLAQTVGQVGGVVLMLVVGAFVRGVLARRAEKSAAANAPAAG